MLRIDRNRGAASACNRRATGFTPGDQTLLVRQREELAGLERGHRSPQSRGPHDRVQNYVGLVEGRELDRAVGPQPGMAHTELCCLALELELVGPGHQADDLEAIGIRADDVEGLRT